MLARALGHIGPHENGAREYSLFIADSSGICGFHSKFINRHLLSVAPFVGDLLLSELKKDPVNGEALRKTWYVEFKKTTNITKQVLYGSPLPVTLLQHLLHQKIPQGCLMGYLISLRSTQWLSGPVQ